MSIFFSLSVFFEPVDSVAFIWMSGTRGELLRPEQRRLHGITTDGTVRKTQILTLIPQKK